MSDVNVENLVQFCKGGAFDSKQFLADIKFVVLVVLKKNPFGKGAFRQLDDLVSEVVGFLYEHRDEFVQETCESVFEKIYLVARRCIADYLRSLGRTVELEPIDVKVSPSELPELSGYVSDLCLDDSVKQSLARFLSSVESMEAESLRFSIFSVAFYSAVFDYRVKEK